MRGSFRCPSPASLFIYVENVDEVVHKATKVGAASQGPMVDSCGTVVDTDGYPWEVGTHKAEPTAKEMTQLPNCILTRKEPVEHEFVRLPESCSTLRPQADSAAVVPRPLVLAA